MDRITYMGQVLERCELCHHAKWEEKLCPNERMHRAISRGISTHSTPVIAEDVVDEIYNRIRKYWTDEDARRFAILISEGRSGNYLKSQGYIIRGGLNVKRLQEKYEKYKIV